MYDGLLLIFTFSWLCVYVLVFGFVSVPPSYPPNPPPQSFPSQPLTHHQQGQVPANINRITSNFEYRPAFTRREVLPNYPSSSDQEVLSGSGRSAPNIDTINRVAKKRDRKISSEKTDRKNGFNI